MSGSSRVDDLEERVATLESRVRLLAAGLVLATVGLGVLIVAPGVVLTWLPTLVVLAIVAIVFGYLQSPRSNDR